VTSWEETEFRYVAITTRFDQIERVLAMGDIVGGNKTTVKGSHNIVNGGASANSIAAEGSNEEMIEALLHAIRLALEGIPAASKADIEERLQRQSGLKDRLVGWFGEGIVGYLSQVALSPVVAAVLASR
jgi:hypothetical protein